jgi:hypothetical protein
MPERYGSKVKKVNAFNEINNDPESAALKELEAEVERLTKELEDTKETVEILKQVVKDYSQRAKQKE